MPRAHRGGSGDRVGSLALTLTTAAGGVQKALAAIFTHAASDSCKVHGRCPDNFYLVQLKAPKHSNQVVEAATLEVHGEHLVFLDSQGKVAALFPMKIVESWIRINP